jgi:NTE family protein
LAHVGVLSVLEEAGLAPACIAGTSMGAIVGALYAESLDAHDVARRISLYTEDPEFKASWEPFVDGDELEERGFLRELRRSIQRRILTFKGFTSPAMQSAERLLDPLGRVLHTRRVEDLQIPFAAVAVDLLSGEPRVFLEGDLVSAIYASSAIPGVFPPLPLDQQLLSDGGGPYRVPVGICRRLGADFVLAVDIPTVSTEKDEYKTAQDVFMRSDQITRSRLNRLVLRQADMVVRPDVSRFHWANFGAADRMRVAGEEAMRDAVPRLRRLLREREGVGYRARRLLERLLTRRT